MNKDNRYETTPHGTQIVEGDYLPPNTYHWMIDRAYGACADEKLPIHGPRDCDVDEVFGPAANRFIIKDDDGNVYYGGLIQGADYHGFEPLDDYGQPN
ncbi:hypothetical protein CMI37_34380, partial [Candidatus Pacearchaeota archaeon]|nr:hypothetical protein [Candidatus Pacearchaeota archaeon]